MMSSSRVIPRGLGAFAEFKELGETGWGLFGGVAECF